MNWRDAAACATVDPELWFPEKGGSVRAAVRICQGCPVRVPCLDWALDRGERWGIWGGVTERARQRMRSRRAAA